ncbi:MAG TPA: plasmid pRiA4b ORF-3 family protein [Spirochaetota bacterium]|nr:plasmid pRiA4b ORF-3 family protein [Spirochaetota bacterium]
MATVKKIKSDQVFQLKITLNDIKPPIWRRILVDSDVKLPDLHKIIQTSMGWINSHLHQFIINDQFYSIPDGESFCEVVDYRRIKLNSLFNVPKSKFIYEYDFGDGWEHTIVIEKILSRDKNTYYPICVDGKRNCPPEDCGGSGGYENLIEIIKDPKHEEYSEMMEWLGGDYNPEEFNIDEVNELLHEKDYGCIELFD